MTTDKYDLHTIDYSVQGWDAILTADMEKLDDVIPSRMLVTLGETVAAYDALYLNADGKWYKAQADGTKQPAFGLAVESGVLDDVIRLIRIGKVTNAAWSWTVAGGVYLDPSTAGAITQTPPSENIQPIGVATASDTIFLVGTMRVNRSSVGLPDATLSGAPKIIQFKDESGVPYYIKAYPTKT